MNHHSIFIHYFELHTDEHLPISLTNLPYLLLASLSLITPTSLQCTRNTTTHHPPPSLALRASSLPSTLPAAPPPAVPSFRQLRKCHGALGNAVRQWLCRIGAALMRVGRCSSHAHAPLCRHSRRSRISTSGRLTFEATSSICINCESQRRNRSEPHCRCDHGMT
jgi:hypothetical protein